MSRRTYTTGLIVLVLAGSVLFTLLNFLNGGGMQFILLVSIGAVVFYTALLIMQLRGVPYTAEILVSSMVFACILAASPQDVRSNVYIAILIPSVFAAALLPPVWSFGTFVIGLVGSLVAVGIRTGSFTLETFGPTLRFNNLLMLVLAAIGIFVSSSLASKLQREAEANARRAQAERDQVELKSRELLEANSQMNEQIEQQGKLIDLVSSLEAPAVQLADGILFAPIVGHMDTRRAQALTTRLLKDVNAQRARLVVLDISGVAVMDTAVAQALLNTAKALRLLGCNVTISGISSSVAITLTSLGIDLDEVQTVRSPQEALSLFAASAAAMAGATA